MKSVQEIQYHRNTERRHMIAAKNALLAGVADLADHNGNNADFVLACVDYLDYIIGRFVEQGRGNTALLRAVVPEDDAQDQRTLADIEGTLTRTADQLAALKSATARYREDPADIESFAGACGAFLDFYDGVLARRKDPAQSIIQKHIDKDTYWERTDDVTTDSINTEKAMFAQIRELAPDGLQLGE